MGQGFQESSRGIAQGGSHSVPSLIRGAALGLFGSGPKIVLYPLGDSLNTDPECCRRIREPVPGIGQRWTSEVMASDANQDVWATLLLEKMSARWGTEQSLLGTYIWFEL